MKIENKRSCDEGRSCSDCFFDGVVGRLRGRRLVFGNSGGKFKQYAIKRFECSGGKFGFECRFRGLVKQRRFRQYQFGGLVAR